MSEFCEPLDTQKVFKIVLDFLSLLTQSPTFLSATQLPPLCQPPGARVVLPQPQSPFCGVSLGSQFSPPFPSAVPKMLPLFSMTLRHWARPVHACSFLPSSPPSNAHSLDVTLG